jgi:glycosyltransferase involved in cell wall biosynthesis
MKRMSLTAHPHVRKSGTYFGYAYAYNEIKNNFEKYLAELGIKLELNTPKSNVQMYFGSPHGFFYPHQYKIQMTQWESTKVPPHWKDFAKGYDEWWTANDFGKQAFIDSGIPEEKVYVFEHGVDSTLWQPKLRGQNGAVRFLHIDSGSPRKRADLAKAAFKKAFGDNPNYEITFKHSHIPSSGVDWNNPKTMATHGEWESKNIRHIRENMSTEDLVKLYHYHDAIIYPSEGEGFGMIPMQALATGMPVISTGRWCSYERYLNNNIIDSHIGQSEIQETYTRFGDVVVPNLDSMVELMRSVAKNIDEHSKVFLDQRQQVIEDYDWYSLSKKAIDPLVERLGLEFFNSSKGYLNKGVKIA